jgi:hypothetical protein
MAAEMQQPLRSRQAAAAAAQAAAAAAAAAAAQAAADAAAAAAAAAATAEAAAEMEAAFDAAVAEVEIVPTVTPRSDFFLLLPQHMQAFMHEPGEPESEAYAAARKHCPLQEQVDKVLHSFTAYSQKFRMWGNADVPQAMAPSPIVGGTRTPPSAAELRSLMAIAEG